LIANTFKIAVVHPVEIHKIPTSVISVATAVPAFIGYTQKASKDSPGDLNFIPTYITSLLEYEQYFGTMDDEIITIHILDQLTKVGKIINLSSREINVQIHPSKNIMYYQMQLFFANGGSECYIVSVGTPKASISKRALKKGLDKIDNFNGPTLIIFPEGANLTKAEDLYNLYNEALVQAYKLRDRFVIMDISKNLPAGQNEIDFFRENISGGTTTSGLKYGAAYYPWLITSMLYRYIDSSVTIVHKTITRKAGRNDVKGNGAFNKLTLNELLVRNILVYTEIKTELAKYTVILPPSAAMAGIYAAIDSSKGVWKAPSASLTNINAPTVSINDIDQESLNVDVKAGKSINAIREFSGRGTLAWGSRTLAGNDNEWRYVSVCRFFMMIANSIKVTLKNFESEPNNINTWITVKSIINDFLILQWRQGALQGIKPDEAFFVRLGLGETMTPQDILNGRMIVEIGMAPVRPAEFIILKVIQQMIIN